MGWNERIMPHLLEGLQDFRFRKRHSYEQFIVEERRLPPET
jgi:hypothetical protein